MLELSGQLGKTPPLSRYFITVYEPVMIDWIFKLIRSIVNKIYQFFWPSKSPTEFTIPVHIKAAGGQTVLFQLSPKWNVREIKKKVAPKIGMKPEEFSIIFAGKCLSDSLFLEVYF